MIFCSNNFIIDNYVYEFYCFCVSFFVVNKIIVVVHDDNYFDFVCCYEKITIFYYVYDLFKFFRNYLKHCFKCLTYQTCCYKLYKFLQLIFTSTIFFYIITINFILILSISLRNFFDCVMTCNCKFFKRILLILNRIN